MLNKTDNRKRNRASSVLMFALILFAAAFPGCENRSIFTELSENRLVVVIKGTYESSGTPRGWLPLQPNGSMQDDSIDDYSGAVDIAPTMLMMDIAELRLDDKKFANERQLISSALDDTDPMFNGDGVILTNDDPVHNKTYSNVNIYFRKMLFDSAVRYQYGSSGWEFVEDVTDIYHEQTVNGFNFNKFQVNTHYDSLRVESSYINRVFPLEVPISGGMYYNRNYEQVVLEIRIVVKNFIKKYEYDYYVDGVQNAIHFFGLSDWLRNIKAGENTQGGNIHSVARYYIPSEAGSITGNNTYGTGYIIAFPASEDISNYTMLSTQTRGGNCDYPVIPNLPQDYVDPLMDYYLKYEKYKSDLNDAVSLCGDFDTYQLEWDTYESEVKDFKIPPLAVWSTGGTYTLDNVQPGDYKVYYLPAPVYGELFLDTVSYMPLNSGSAVTVPVNGAVTAN